MFPQSVVPCSPQKLKRHAFLSPCFLFFPCSMGGGGGGGERGALLGSIQGFAKGKLKKAVTNDRSGALV
eukprot:m.143385 g.143385  ORF g.143385 m.143385 type:complete len:69 (+) comp16738_c0_seq9:1857-2063(+)